MKKKFDPIQLVEDDGNTIMDVGGWSIKKYRLAGHYCNIFTQAMRNKWNLIYLDLFSGPGYVRLKESKQIIKNSALIALSLEHKFDHYIFNDLSKENYDSLSQRIQDSEYDGSYSIYNEDANHCIQKVLQERPSFNNGKGNLTFCFLDPFSLNLTFETVKELANENVDILMLHALQMDGNRNLTYYIREENERIASFTGNPHWREGFEKMGNFKGDFMRFLSEEYDRNIQSLGYLNTIKEMIKNNTGRGIYYLAFYSKHPLGIKFFEESRKRIDEQLDLF
ncbi:MAG: three-Cys-motif partner protein TcmP [Cyclobacteriaceae bacterium]